MDEFIRILKKQKTFKENIKKLLLERKIPIKNNDNIRTPNNNKYPQGR